jgi:hypothetical protein
MSNDIHHLRKALFSQLDRLTDTETMKNPITRAREIETSKQVAEVSKQIIETAKVEVQFMKQMNKTETSFVKEIALPAGNDKPALTEATVMESTPAKPEEPEPEWVLQLTTPKKMSKTLIEKQRMARKADAELLKVKPTINSDTSKKQAVKIDHRTTIYIALDKDPEEARQKYLERNSISKIKDNLKEQ